ncbi:MAG: alpha/beta hydrolase-fold protein [Candidatus Neomarinimicrobiota bacterium]
MKITKFRLKPLLTLILPILLNSIHSQIYIGDYMGIQSEILGEQRVLLVHLPDEYTQTEIHYPVLYLLDGDDHFHHVTGLIDRQADLGLMPRMIVVGLRNSNRNRDFTPTSVNYLSTSGGADQFLEFLSNELIPSVDSQFRTAPYRMLVGHSLGGLLTAYAFLNKPDLFSSYIILSPDLLYDEENIFSGAADRLKAMPATRKSVYLAVGSSEEKLINPSQRLNRLIRKNTSHNIKSTFEVIKYADHGTVVHQAIYSALEKIFGNWRFPPADVSGGLSAIQLHYNKLSEELGYPVIPYEADINAMGYALLKAGRRTAALDVFKYNVRLYPNSANAYDSLGEGYAALSDLESALDNYRIAVRKGEESEDPNLFLFRQHRDAIDLQIKR